MTEINDYNGAFLPDDINMPEPRTNAEVTELKRNWLNDPCWDIEDTEGFEYHYMELRRWHEALEDEQRVNEINRVTTRGVHLGFTYEQMRFIESLERQIRSLQQAINVLQEATQ